MFPSPGGEKDSTIEFQLNCVNPKVLPLGHCPDLFSATNSDVVYLLTNFNLYKKFVSNIVGNIGAYSFVQNITGNSINVYTTPLLYDLSVITPARNNANDYIAMYAFDQIVFYSEQLTYNAIIK